MTSFWVLFFLLFSFGNLISGINTALLCCSLAYTLKFSFAQIFLLHVNKLKPDTPLLEISFRFTGI